MPSGATVKNITINGVKYDIGFTTSPNYVDNYPEYLNDSMPPILLIGQQVESLSLALSNGKVVSILPISPMNVQYTATNAVQISLNGENESSGESTRSSSPSTPKYILTTLTNSQNVATLAPFQQMITFDPSTYSQYENSNLGNIRFYQGSTELYSWCESGCSNTSSNAVFWVKLPNGIGAKSSTGIYMIFKPMSTNYDGVYAGEAPQLSPTYAEYDNGANVFNFYDNFAGTSLNASKWESYGSLIYTCK